MSAIEMIDENVIVLSRPVDAHGEKLSRLVLREPSTEEILEEGYPYLVIPGAGGATGIQLQPKVVARYVMRLAGIPLSSVKQMHISDLQKAQVVVMGFFGKGEDDQSSS